MKIKVVTLGVLVMLLTISFRPKFSIDKVTDDIRGARGPICLCRLLREKTHDEVSQP